MAGMDREALIVKIMRAADAGLISTADRDRRIDNVRRSGSDVELQLIEADIDRLMRAAVAPTTPPVASSPWSGRSERFAPAAGGGSRVAVLGPVLLVIVAVMGLAVTVIYRAMRSVMEIGGACASGGPYVPVQACPDHTWMIGPAIPVLVIAAMIGTGLAVAVKAPHLIVPMWAALFGALGWNFIDFAVRDGDVVAGWLVCGVMFWLMALPAVLAMLGGGLLRRKLTKLPAAAPAWWLAYAVAAGAGIWCGSWIWTRLG